MDSFYSEQNNGIILRIKAVPNSSKNEICGLIGDALKIKIKAPAVENKANEELVKFLSKLFKVSKTSITFKSGDTSKLKTLYISGCTIDKIKDVCANIDV